MILYIDTLALLYRSYYAIPNLTTPDGVPTGALFGLTSSLFRAIEDIQPDHIVACFDRPEKTLRQESCAGYKANRETPEEDMIAQIEAARTVLISYGVHVVEKAGYEADDLIGTLAVADAKKKKQVIIVSCDGDLLQLTTHRGVQVYFLQKGMNDFTLYDEKKAEERNGYPAKYIIDYKGLAGDASDNIVGVPGIGDTFARRLITAFGDLDSIYKALDAGDLLGAGFTKRVEKLLQEGREQAFSSRDLATIQTQVPIVSPHKDSKVWRERLVYDQVLKTLENYAFISLIPRLNTIAGVSDSEQQSIKGESDDSKTEPATIDTLSEEDRAIAKEAVVALWVLDASQTNASLEDVYAHTKQRDPAASLKVLLDQLKKTDRLSVWNLIERPLLPVIDRMEEVGVCFDVDAAKVLSTTYHKKIAQLTKKIYSLAGREFNINSPKQLGEVLYGDLELRPKRISKTATGKRTTKESVLLGMADDHPIIPLVLTYRHYEKLRSTYTDALPNFVGDDGRIHTHLQQNGTTTGRLSSHDPNLQNIPISGEDGLALRKLFIAPDGWTLVSIDYSQMELRLAAILSGEKGLLKIFKENGDIHTSVASQVLGVPEDAVTADQRASAKAINFGILYGMGAQSLRQTLKVSFADAERFLVEYKKAFPMLFTYFDSVKKQALSSGFVTTAFGRVRPIEGASSSLQFVRSQAERMAVNSVVQGTAADVIKLAMVGVDAMIQERALGDQVRMVLQIHDELLFEIRPDVVDSVVGDIITIMESVYPPNQTPIRLTANAKKGQSWGSLL